MTTGEIMTLLAVRDFHFKHNLGQNFLADERVLSEIVRVSGVSKEETVLEIGAGAGTLTNHLADASSCVLAVEIDEELAGFLKEVLKGKENVSILCRDILSVDLDTELARWAPDGKYRVISNLPYYITSDILEQLILLRNLPSSMTVMVQKEAADHLLARAGERNCSPLSILLEYLYDGKAVLDVPRTAFDPEPHIDSTVLHFAKREEASSPEIRRLRTLLRTSFRMRRKTWVNNLYPNYFQSREDAASVITNLGLDARIRPEQVPLSAYLKMLATFR